MRKTFVCRGIVLAVLLELLLPPEASFSVLCVCERRVLRLLRLSQAYSGQQAGWGSKKRGAPRYPAVVLEGDKFAPTESVRAVIVCARL